MPDGIKNTNNRVRYTRQTIVTNTFYQMPRFLTAGEFAGNRLSNNARILYTLLLDRHRISVKNGWYDDNGEVYIYFKREEMEKQLGLSDKTVVKALHELKNLFLVEEKQQGMNRPNKIYLLSPIIGNDENPDPYIDLNTDYNPEINEDYGYDSEPVISPASDTEDLRSRTRNNSDPGQVRNSVPGHGDSPASDTEELRPNDNKLINNKKKNNNLSDNEVSKTATAISETEPPAAAAEAENENPSRASQDAWASSSQSERPAPIPYSQILELYNRLCETAGLRSIRSIDGKRKTQTAARFATYGLSGFIDLFDRVLNSGFLCGNGERGWKADFDWLIAPTNMQKVLEGKYNDDQNNVPLRQEQIYETYPQSNFLNTPQNKQERRDPFLERALMAYETAKSAAI